MPILQASGLVTAPALARTYSHPSYADAWECVMDYRKVLEYHQTNPGVGTSKIARVFELPRSRIRPWLKESVPDPVRAIRAARNYGWLDPDFTDRSFRGLNVLVAWILSGGSLNSNYVPQFAITENDRQRIDAAFEATGIAYDFIRGGDDQRATEYRPIENASVLGRVLWVLDAPLGRKNEEASIVIPNFLADSPSLIRQEFVKTYLANRGNISDADGAIRFREDRSPQYLDDLSELIHQTTGEPVKVSEKNLILTNAAAENVRAWPSVLE